MKGREVLIKMRKVFDVRFCEQFFSCSLTLTIAALIPFLNRHGAQLWRNMHKGMQKHAKGTTPVRSTGSTSPVVRSHVAGLVKMAGVAIDVCIYNKIFDFKRKKHCAIVYIIFKSNQSINQTGILFFFSKVYLVGVTLPFNLCVDIK